MTAYNQLTRGASRLGATLQRLGGALVQPPWPEAGLFLALGATHLYNSLVRPYPVGYAGLYSLMAELVARQPFPMPSQIPFYGPDGIPFAYPPLGAYLAAVFLAVLRLPLFTYLKWAPPLMTLAALAALYYLARGWTGDRLKAVAAVAAAGSAEITYAFHSTASGMMRAPALAFALAGAHFALKAYSSDRRRWPSALLAGLFLALAAMTHLVYAVFLTLGVLLMCLMASAPSNWPVRLKVLGAIGLASVVLSAPWWATIWTRHGPAVLAHAAGTHGNFDMLGGSPLATLREVLRWLANYGRSWHPTILGGLGLLGFAYAVASGHWLMPAWLVLSLVVIGQSERFQVILSGIMVGNSLVDLSRLATHSRFSRARPAMERVGSLACISIVLAPLLVLGLRGVQWTPTSLTEELYQAAAWIQEGTPEAGHYLYLGEGHDEAEWLPFLSRRSPAIGQWGTEWTGDYDRQLALTAEMEACLDSPRTACIETLVEESGVPVTTLLVRKEDMGLLPALQADPHWELAYENEIFAVFLRAE